MAPKIGRPTKATPERIDTILEGIRAGLTYEVAAKRAGINRSTLAEWRKKGESGDDEYFAAFYDGIKKAEAEAEFELLNQIKCAGYSPERWQALAWILERRYPDRYGRIDRLKAELTGRDGDPIQIARAMSDEEVIQHVERFIESRKSDSS